MQQYAETWASTGHQVTVITSWDKGLARQENVRGVHIIRTHTVAKKNRATTSLFSMFSYIVTGFLYICLHRNKFGKIDIINTHFAIPTGPLGVFASKVLNIPNVLTIIGGDIYDPTKKSSPHRSAMLRFVNRRIINSASSVIAISSDTKKRAETYYQIEKRIVIINYGFIPFELKYPSRSDLGLSPDKYYLIAVGRLVKRKGFDYLIRAIKQLSEEIHLLLIGDGPMDHELRNLIHTEKLTERVSLLGFQTREQIIKYFEVSDCFILSSMHEGLGIVVQEAMYTGLPIVATNNGGQVDLIKENRNGLLVEPSNVEKLAQTIALVHSNSELADSFRENNKIDIQKYFMDENSKEYIKVFESVMDV